MSAQTTAEEKTFQLKTSDIVAGLGYAGLEMVQGKPFKIMTVLESILYNTLGRVVNKKTDLLDFPPPEDGKEPFLSNDNVYGALLSFADSKLRQKQNLQDSTIDALKQVASAIVGNKVLEATKMENKIILSF
jgi:hypothetical protein